MSGPFDTSHLRAIFFREVDDDATAAAIEAAEKEGRPLETVKPVYVERCRIKYAGDPKTETVFNAHDKFQYFRPPGERHATWFTCAEFFPEQYEQFSQGLDQVQAGIPLEELPFLSPGLIELLHGLEINTCEALAGLEGDRLRKIGPKGRTWQMRAKAHLDQVRAQDDKTDLVAQIHALQREVNQLKGGAAGKLAQVKAAAGADDGLTPPAHLKGAARAQWIKKHAQPAEPSPPAKKAAKPEDAGEGSGGAPDARAMLEGMEEVDLRNMISAYGGTPKPGAKKAQLVEMMLEINEKAERGLKATESA